jgi:hypothetical protein
VVGAVVIPLASVALAHGLDNASRVETLEKLFAVHEAAIQSNNLASQFTDLRGLLSEVYARLDGAHVPVPEIYWEAVKQSQAARLNLVKGNLDEASEQIASAYQKVYSIPLPVGPPLIHDTPIGIEPEL